MATLIKGGTVVTAEGEFRADVLVVGERIAAVGPDLEAPAGARVIDAGGAYVMPGGIDPHTHMEMPFMGTVTSEDFFSGTSAAVAGGTTMIIDFAIPSHGQGLVDAWKMWRGWAEKSVTDYGLHLAVTWWGDLIHKDMGTLCREHGVNSYKYFMAYKGSLMADDEVLVNGFRRGAELGALSAVHAENGELVVQLQRKLYEAGITGPEGHPQSRPPMVEGEAAHRATRLAEALDIPLYIVHNSCADAAEAIARAKMAGQIVFGEVLVQHLVKDDSGYYDKDWNVAAHHVMSPPFRPKAHQEALWKALQAGIFQTTATDHCCFSTEQKRAGFGDFRKIPNGTGGVEDRMALLWTHGVRTGRLTPSEFVAATSTQAARIFNIYPRKGSVTVGADADLVVWDPTGTRTLSKTTHHMKIDFSIFEGMVCTGIPAITLSRGRVVWENGQLHVERGAGRYVERPCFAPFWKAQTARNAARQPVRVER